MKYIPYIKSIKLIKKEIIKIVKNLVEHECFNNRKEEVIMNMKFVKGLVVGGLISTGIIMMWNDTNSMTSKKMAKKGKQFAKKMGLM